MKEKWKRPTEPKTVKDGQYATTPKFISITATSSDTMYKPKLQTKSPSIRAINNYNNLSIGDTKSTYDNLNFIPVNGGDNYDDLYINSTVTSTTLSAASKNGIFPNNFNDYDYTTLGSSSIKTTSNNGSELGSEKNEMGSTTKLVSPKFKIMSYQTWFTHLQTVLCTISFAVGFGNLYRLPQATLIRGGIPFLVAYIILTIIIGLPLLFLELGLGQLAQEGFIKSWRAVPFFRGVGYVKLIAGCLLSVYYPLYMGLALYYVIWTAKGPLPYEECSVVKIKETGYSADGIDGQQCLRKTFLQSPFEDPSWYGIFAAILFLIWIIVTILSIRRTKSFIRSLCVFLFPVVACLIALTVKSILVENELKTLKNVFENTDWTVLGEASVWYYAAIQVFFSTYVGFGPFVTNAGIIYNKVSPLWTALGYLFVNLLFGIGSVIITYVLSGNLDSVALKIGDISELHLISVIYTAAIKSEDHQSAQIWACIAYAAIFFSGFISMATITYTLLKAITVQNRRRLKWWQASIVLSFVALVLGCAILLKTDFQLVRLLDHYIVGNLILISVIIEVFALIAFYGTERIKSDFEFMLGHILSKIWLLLWWSLPLLLTAIFVWALTTLPYEDIFISDPEWLYGVGWGIVLVATIFIFVVGFHTTVSQDGYTFKGRLKASLKPSHKWGPKDPMLRHKWVQWNTKAQQGERDFTLKRQGTRDYTRSIKRETKRAASDSTLNRPVSNTRSSNSSSGYNEPYFQTNEVNTRPLRVTSIVDSLEPPNSPYFNQIYHGDFSEGRTNINPLSRTRAHNVSESSEESGTFRKGPYVIPDANITHVCHRRFSEDATEL